MSLLLNGLSGLSASQKVLEVASQNIANLNTPGYTRQDAVLMSRGGGSDRLSSGNGVEVTAIRRIADDYRVATLWRASSQFGYDDRMQTLVQQVEGIVGSDELSVNKGLDTLFAAFNAATEAPQSIATRQQILASASALADRFNQLAHNLDIQQRQIDEQAVAMTASINSQTASIARLNERIADVQARGGNTAQLQDQRDLAIKELAGHMELRTQAFPDGRVNVTLSSGQPLVLGNKSATLDFSGGTLSLELEGQNFPVDQPGGEMGALLTYRDVTLADIRGRLDTQAQDLADQINNQLAAGFDLNGNPGAALFQYDPASPSGTLELNPAITPEELAFIGDGGSGNPVGGSGDNSNLLDVVALKTGFYDNFSGLVGDIAIGSAQAQAQADASQSLLHDAQNQRDSVSGVNQDEEAIRLMTFTQAYQANAKVISTADQVFNTLLGMF